MPREADPRGIAHPAWERTTGERKRSVIIMGTHFEEADMQTGYGFGKTVALDFDQAIARVTAALQAEGFGVLADIDVAATLEKKLGRAMPPYRILGACNPPLAHRALETDPSIGLLLPCNVVVRRDEQGVVHVEFMDPEAVLKLVDHPGIATLAHEVRERLSRVMAAV